ncbi:hypothetical protein EVAR_99945_1 [Eumeta japonica]|uniref:Uncharacterized protein n=1 Tax=Eumeta variegata TaxID=151549 RepID=A0A4C1ZFL4_EUMVA|nr:hypothetical protein EVAR_99945_1 [Eumeta japonica]
MKTVSFHKITVQCYVLQFETGDLGNVGRVACPVRELAPVLSAARRSLSAVITARAGGAGAGGGARPREVASNTITYSRSGAGGGVVY